MSCVYYPGCLDQRPLLQSPGFKCIHLRTQCIERTSIFDPTPPTQPAQKVEFYDVALFSDDIPEKHQKIGDFVVTSHSLGSGSFATVHLAMDRLEHRQVACKIIKAKHGKDVSSLMKEVDILTAVHHVWFSLFPVSHPNVSWLAQHQPDSCCRRTSPFSVWLSVCHLLS